MADCLTQTDRWYRILPIGGLRPAIAPRHRGEALFALLGAPPRFTSVPIALLGRIALLPCGRDAFDRQPDLVRLLSAGDPRRCSARTRRPRGVLNVPAEQAVRAGLSRW